MILVVFALLVYIYFSILGMVEAYKNKDKTLFLLCILWLLFSLVVLIVFSIS